MTNEHTFYEVVVNGIRAGFTLKTDEDLILLLAINGYDENALVVSCSRTYLLETVGLGDIITPNAIRALAGA